MKELKFYQCEFCKTQYSLKEECEACENFHNKKLKIRDKFYLGYKNDRNQFPNRIVVVDESGQTAQYNRG